MASRIIAFTLAERNVEVMVKPMTPLLSVLRDQLDYTAAKEGCRQGGCGTCTVLVDGEPMLACLLPVEDIAGRQVTTVETISSPTGPNRLQQAFLDHGALQCGYCTPGMIMLATALLEHDPHPTRATIVDALAGNVCRCTGYAPIVDAIEAAVGAETAQTAGGGPQR